MEKMEFLTDDLMAKFKEHLNKSQSQEDQEINFSQMSKLLQAFKLILEVRQEQGEELDQDEKNILEFITVFEMVRDIVEKMNRPTQHENAPDMVNHPPHYKREGRKECIDEMYDQFGRRALIHHCFLTAYKYQYRNGLKAGSEDTDAGKEEWYINKGKELIASDPLFDISVSKGYDEIIQGVCFAAGNVVNSPKDNTSTFYRYLTRLEDAIDTFKYKDPGYKKWSLEIRETPGWYTIERMN